MIRGDAYQKLGHAFNWPLCRGEADPLQWLFAESLQAFQAEREMRAAFVADECVDLIDNDSLGLPQRGSSFLGSQQQVQRLRRGDQDVRRLADERRTLRRRAVSGAQANSDRSGLLAVNRAETRLL